MLVIFLIGSAQHTMFEFDENEFYTPFLLLCVLSVLPNLKFSCVPSIRDSSSSRTWWWLSNELIANEYLSLIGIVHFDHVTSMNIFSSADYGLYLSRAVFFPVYFCSRLVFNILS